MSDAAPSQRVPSLSLLFPAFNDAGTIASMVLAARSTARRLTDDFEILVVNDGSRDPTAEILEELKTLVPELRVLQHPLNRGYGAALRTGFAAATKELVFYTDGDAQFEPQELRLLVEVLAPDVDYVSGYKVNRADPLLRVILGKPYHWLLRKAFRLRLKDIDCDFRLFRRPVLERIALYESNGAMGIELLKKLEDGGFRFREVPVHHHPRVYGRSQYYTPRHVLRQYAQLFRLWMELSGRKSRASTSPVPVRTADETKVAP